MKEFRKYGNVSGVTKAICFISPGEYPEKYKFDPEKNVSIFKEFIERTKVNRFDLNAHYQMKHEVEKIGESSKLELDNLNKFVVYLYGKLKCKKMTTLESKTAAKKVKSNNLGNIPHSIRYVDSLSVLDTYVNPYKNYELAPRKKISKAKPKPEPEAEKEIISITNYVKPEYVNETQRYKPTTQAATDIDIDDDIGIDGIVEFDLDDFLDGMTTTTNKVVEKKVLSDPYKGKSTETPTQASQISTSSAMSNNYAAPAEIPYSAPPSAELLMPSLPPPPPISSLPPPPSLTNLLPPGGLPPPPGPPPPVLTLSAPPPLLSPPSMPTFSASGNSRGDLLKELNSDNPMARLKKTVTKESPNIADNKKPAEIPVGENGEPTRPLSLMEALQLKIKNRFKALHPEGEDEEDD